MATLAVETEQKLAQDWLSELRQTINVQGHVYLKIGYILKIFREEKLYRYLGDGGYDSFTQFLASPEVGISYSTAYALITIYNRYILQYKFAMDDLQGIPWYKLQLLSGVEPATDDDAKEWVEKARTLGNADLRLEVHEHRKNKGFAKPLPYPHVYRCRDCGFWRIEVDPKNECHCVQPI